MDEIITWPPGTSCLPALSFCNFTRIRDFPFNSHALGYYVCHGPLDRTDFWFLKNVIGHRYHISANRMYIRKIVGREGGGRQAQEEGDTRIPRADSC